MTGKIIRRPDRAEGGITTEEKARMDEHAKLWSARAKRTDPIEPDKIVPAIKGLYAAAKLKEPRVVIVPSPLVMAFAYGAATEIWRASNATDSATANATHDATRSATYDATHNATRSATRNATRSATYDATHDATANATANATRSATRNATRNATHDATANATHDATRSATYDATRNATDSATYDATADAMANATHDATANATRNATRSATDDATTNATHGAAAACVMLAGREGLASAQNWTYAHQGGNMWAAWDCYLTAARDILGLKLSSHGAYKYWEEAAIHGSFRVMHPEFCFVSDFPEVLRVDEQSRSHCETGPSHRWRDGWSLYHWHGVEVPGEWIEDKASLTPEIALRWENIEQRRAACEILGWTKMLAALKAKTIDKDDDPEIGELIEAAIPDSGEERFLRVLCGTKREFVLPVPREMKTALQANAWTFGFDDMSSFIKPEIRT